MPRRHGWQPLIILWEACPQPAAEGLLLLQTCEANNPAALSSIISQRVFFISASNSLCGRSVNLLHFMIFVKQLSAGADVSIDPYFYLFKNQSQKSSSQPWFLDLLIPKTRLDLNELERSISASIVINPTGPFVLIEKTAKRCLWGYKSCIDFEVDRQFGPVFQTSKYFLRRARKWKMYPIHRQTACARNECE